MKNQNVDMKVFLTQKSARTRQKRLDAQKRREINFAKLKKELAEKQLRKEQRERDKVLFSIYSKKARKLTEEVYEKYKKTINPLSLRRGFFDYHLDHVCSLNECFKNNIPVYIAVNPYNLRLIPAKRNKMKGKHSTFPFSQLIPLYKQFLNDKLNDCLSCRFI